LQSRLRVLTLYLTVLSTVPYRSPHCIFPVPHPLEPQQDDAYYLCLSRGFGWFGKHHIAGEGGGSFEGGYLADMCLVVEDRSHIVVAVY
jgi:hypothetical protein